MSEKEIPLEVIFKTAVDFHTKGRINDAKNLYEKIFKTRKTIQGKLLFYTKT